MTGSWGSRLDGQQPRVEQSSWAAHQPFPQSISIPSNHHFLTENCTSVNFQPTLWIYRLVSLRATGFLRQNKQQKNTNKSNDRTLPFALPISAYSALQLFPHLLQSSNCFPPSLIPPLLTTAPLLLYLILLNYFCQQFHFWKINSEKLQMETPRLSWIRNWTIFKSTSISSFLTTTSPY